MQALKTKFLTDPSGAEMKIIVDQLVAEGHVGDLIAQCFSDRANSFDHMLDFLQMTSWVTDDLLAKKEAA